MRKCGFGGVIGEVGTESAGSEVEYRGGGAARRGLWSGLGGKARTISLLNREARVLVGTLRLEKRFL